MRDLPYGPGARKRTVSLTLNADLYAKAKGQESTCRRLPKRLLRQALAERLAEQVKADIRRDLGALNAFVETHGSFAEMVREHYATIDGDAPV